MNEKLFSEIAEKDFETLKMYVSKGYFETSEFLSAIQNLANSLAILRQVIEEC